MIGCVKRGGRACALLVLGAWGLGGCGSRATHADARDADGPVEAAPDLSSDVHDDVSLDAALEALDVDAGDTAAPTGCGAGAPAGDSETEFVVHTLDVPDVSDIYLGTGKESQFISTISFAHRLYTLKLPIHYDPSRAYPVTFGAPACGGSALTFSYNPDDGFRIAPDGETIEVGLSFIENCFADGGPSIDNRSDTPEVPYFRAVLAEVEARTCVDRSRVFVAGVGSGAWEAITLGSSAADVIRGIGTDGGGLRLRRPPSTGPLAALLVVGEADTVDPIGPLSPGDPEYIANGSLGSAAARDDLLARNGCVGTATAPWDPDFPACLTYTGCPPAYPVVWCPLPGVGSSGSFFDGVTYAPGGMWRLLSSLPAP
jgi:hypothetical protein